MAPTDQRCEQCVRFYRPYNLASPVAELDKLSSQKNKLLDEISANKTRTRRLRKQRRLLLKKIRKLGDREAQNIAELKINEIIDNGVVKNIPETSTNRVSAKTLNSPSPQPSSFFDSALLNSLDKSSSTLSHNK
jgi:hypothetical protein